MKKVYIVILSMLVLILVGCNNQEAAPSIKKTSEKVVLSFKEEYPNVTEEHPFIERNIYQIEKIFNDKMTGTIFFGFPDCPKCQQITVPLEKAAINNNIKTISYFNPLIAREQNNEDYQKMISYFAEILPSDEYGHKTLTVPLILFVKEGTVIDYHQGSLDQALIESKTLDDALNNQLINIFDAKLKKIYIEGL